ncbi:MAG: hypothetical protein RLN82_01110 [Pseudomonadales bacterium]
MAESLYMTGMTGKEISDYVKTSETQISRWKKEGKWEELRKVKTISNNQLIMNAYKASQAIYDLADKDDRVLNSKETDQVLKLSATVKNLERELNVQTATLVFKGFNEHLIKSGQLDLAKEFIEHQREFVLSLMPNE